MNKLSNERTTPIAPLLLVLLLLCLSALTAAAQEGGPALPAEGAQDAVNPGGDLGRILGLTPDQLTKIRMIRQQNREAQRLVNERLRSAQQALDEAIYSDDASEAVVEERARELAAAQAAAVRQRALTELGIRRVLTPEQLNTLRDLRLRQAQRRRLERQLNQPGRSPDNNGAPPTFPRDRFRQRPNNSTRPTNSLPAASTPEQRRAPLRQGRP